MIYDAYERKMKRIAKVLATLRRFRVPILSVCAAIVIATGAWMATRGMITSDVTPPTEPFTYGDTMSFDAKALFSEVHYEFRAGAQEEWSTEMPRMPGSYECRAVGEKFFGGVSFGEVFTVTIEPAKLMLEVQGGTAVYGDDPRLDESGLMFFDTITTFSYAYATPEELSTTVSIDASSVVILNERGEDVTAAYEIVAPSQTIEFSPRPITVTLASAEKIYDGTPLHCGDFTVNEGGLVGEDRIELGALAALTDAGEMRNEAGEITAYNKNGDNITKKYRVQIEYGTLRVLPRPLVITSEDAQKTFDGEALTHGVWKLTEGELIGTHALSVQVTGAQKLAGSSANTMVAQVTDADGRDVSANYATEYQAGTLTVARRRVGLLASSVETVYNGKMQYAYELGAIFSFVSGAEYDGMLASHVLICRTDGSAIDAGVSAIGLADFSALGQDDVDYADCYEFIVQEGTLTILPRHISVIAGSGSFEYDGLTHSGAELAERVMLSDGTLAEGHRMDATLLGSIRNVGSVQNVVQTVSFYDAAGKAVPSGNYVIDSTAAGDLSVTRRAITVKVTGGVWEYDGTAHGVTYEITKDQAELALATGDSVSLLNYDAPILVGKGSFSDFAEVFDIVSELSTADYRQTDNGAWQELGRAETVSMLHNYDITFDTSEADWEIYPRRISVHAQNVYQIYNGSALTSDGYTLFYEGDYGAQEALGAGDSLSVVMNGTVTNAGQLVKNRITEATVQDAQGKDVTFCYEIATENGYLYVLPRPVQLVTPDVSKEYDGYALTNDTVTFRYGEVDHALPEGYEWVLGGAEPNSRPLAVGHDAIDFHAIGSITDVGSIYNSIQTGRILDANGADVTKNYSFTLQEGILEVVPRKITVATPGYSWVYDGQTHSGAELEPPVAEKLEDSSLPALVKAQQLHVLAYTGSIRNVGTVENTVDVAIMDGERDVTFNYDIHFAYGTLEVTPRALTVQTGSDKKIYDGVNLTCKEYEILSGELAANDSFNLIFPSLTNVGEIENMPRTVRIYGWDENGMRFNATNNYEITWKVGYLSVAVREIDLIASSGRFEYDGQKHSGNDLTPLFVATMTNDNRINGIAEGQTLTVVLSGTITRPGTVENKIVSYIITGANGQTVQEGNYLVHVYSGTLEVYAREISVAFGEGIFEYDGEDHTVPYEIIKTDAAGKQVWALVDGHYAVLTFSDTIRDVGEKTVYASTFNVYDAYGNPMTDCYVLSEDRFLHVDQPFTLKVTPRPFTIAAGSKSWIYDGKVHTGSQIRPPYLMQYTGLYAGSSAVVAGHSIRVELSGEISEVGSTANRILAVVITDADGNIVTQNYAITDVAGVLEILPRPITVESANQTWEYDGKLHTATEVDPAYTLHYRGKEDYAPLAEGHTVEILLASQIRNVGQMANKITGIVIRDAQGKDVTDQYDIEQIEGVLTVIARKISVTASGKIWTYDGKWHSGEEIDPAYVLTYLGEKGLSDALAEGHSIQVVLSGKICDVGEETNRVASVQILDAAGKDVTENYNIKTISGKLIVEQRVIRLRTGSASKVYDGTSLSAPTYDVLYGSVVEGQQLIVSRYATLTDAGSIPNIVQVQVLDADGRDVSHNYDFGEITYGTLTVTRRSLTVVTGSAEKPYDGTPLTCDEVIGNGLVGGHWISIRIVGSQTEIGSSHNTYEGEVRVLDENGRDVTNNYEMAVGEGILHVINPTKSVLKLQATDRTKVYTGTPLTASGYRILEGALQSGHKMTLTYEGSITDVGKTVAYITGVVIVDENGVDVTESYEIITYPGTLEVRARSITLSTADDSKYYDGTPLENTTIKVVSGSLAGGTVSGSFGSITDAGSIENYTEFVIMKNGVDVTHNFTITPKYGKLTVLPRKIVVSLGVGSFVYDGKSHNGSEIAEPYTVAFDGDPTMEALVAGHLLRLTYTSSITSVGSVLNTAVATVVDANGMAVPSQNYEIRYENGKLTVTPRRIAVTVSSVDWEYDGAAHGALEEITSLMQDLKPLADGDELKIVYDRMPVNVGTYTVKLQKLSIVNARGESVTSNYEIEFSGEKTVQIIISARHIAITAGSGLWYYDGLLHRGSSLNPLYYLTYTGGNEKQLPLVRGHRVVITTEGEVVMGVVPHRIVSYQILDESGADVSANYGVALEEGMLIVLERVFVIRAGSGKWLYDGKVHTGAELAPAYTMTWETRGEMPDLGGLRLSKTTDVSQEMLDGLRKGDTIEVVLDGSICEVGKVVNRMVSVVIRNEAGEDVTAQYAPTFVDGTLTVMERKITVITHSDIKLYDGTPLICDSYTVSPKLADGHRVSIRITGMQTEVGKTLNTFELDILDEFGNSVLHLYEVTAICGSLEVVDDPSKLPDGKDDPYGESDLGDLTDFDQESGSSAVLLLQLNAQWTGRILLRDTSAGKYLGSGWSAAPVYNSAEDGRNPLTLPGVALSKQYLSGEVQIRLSDGYRYVTPYYYEHLDPSQNSDVKIDLDMREYTVTCVPYAYLQRENVLALSGEYAVLEQKYRTYVYENYIELPESTRLAMLELAMADDGIRRAVETSDQEAIIRAVCRYVQNAAVYDLNTPNYPKGVDVAVYFLTEAKSGVCEHFATAATCMLRALNVPARYTVGVAADAVEGEWMDVTSGARHAWVEVYVDGLGWFAVDPTVGDFGEEGGSTPEEGGDEEQKPKIVITPYNLTRFYTGALISCNDEDFLISEGKEALAGYTVRVKLKGSGINATEATGAIPIVVESYEILDADGKDVTDAFDVECQTGMLNIRRLMITLASESVTREYDATPLRATKCWISKGQLAQGQTLKATASGVIVSSGSVENVIHMADIRITDASGNLIDTDNYEISFDFGMLTVTPPA